MDDITGIGVADDFLIGPVSAGISQGSTDDIWIRGQDMWNEIINNKTLKEFNEKLSYFHDSCIKEIHYLSGAYVDERLDMYPINDCRIFKSYNSMSK